MASESSRHEYHEDMAEAPVDPEPSSSSPSDPQREAMERTAQVDRDEEFPEGWKTEFEGLLYLGYLTERVQIPFHSFQLRTLKAVEKIEVSLLSKDLEGSLGYSRKYKALCVAAALVTVDGREILTPNRAENAIPQKYRYVVENWYDPVIDFLYVELDKLEGRVIQIMQELGIVPTADE